MTFSGLPSLRDPKHSLKNSNSGSSQQQQCETAVLGTADHPTINVAPPSTTTTSAVEVVRPVVTGSSSGAAMISVAVANVPTETTPIPTSLIESSFQGLIQSSFGHVLNSLPPQGMVASQGSMSNPSMVDLHQQQAQSSSPVSMLLPPMAASPTPIVTMKKATPQSLSPAHSAAYRKRLNVNQVCDWCRYRKIRCDRESPCNSCQHSKRECIRTPPSALLAIQLQTPTEDQEPIVSSPASSSGRTKRARAANKDGRSRRASKSYRGSSISSHHSSSYTSLSSDNNGSDEEGEDEDEDEDEDEQKSTSGSRVGESSVSPVVGSLTLTGLGFSSLGLGLGSLGSNLGLDARRGSDFHMASPTSFDSSMAAFQESAMPQQMSLQDQEHLERMQRIEMLLSNVIPGAAEFITSGSQGSLHVQQQHHQNLMQQQRQASVVKKKDLSLLTQNLDLHEQQSQHDRILSPQDRLAKMTLSSPAINTAMSMPWSNSPSGLSSLCEKSESTEPSQSSSSSSSLPLMSSSDYIERMKKIEMLLGTIQDVPLAKALISQSEGQTLSSGSSRSNSVDVADNTMLSKKVSKRNLKKQGRGDGKKSNYNSDGTIIKRPHVAAGFAGQKPPPKLPQAIAEAAQKKQATRKKRVTAAAAAKAAAAAAAVAASASADTTATRSETNNVSSPPMPMGGSSLSTVQGADGVKMDSRMMTISTMASLEIPSTFDNESSSTSSFAHQQQQQQQQQQQHQQRMLSIQQHQQHQHQMQMAQHRNSISFQSQSQLFNPYQQQQLPMSGASSMNINIADSTSSYGSLIVPASSSTSSSPSSSPSISRATIVGQDNGMGVSEQQHPQPPQQQHISFPQTQLSGDFEMGFDMHQGMSSGSVLQATNDTHIHPFGHSDQQQQQHQRQSIQTDQDGFADFGLNMDESLEGLMKKSMGSFGHLMESFSNDSSSLLEHHHHQLHQQQQQQQVLAPSTPTASVDQFSYFQNLQQTPTPQQQQQFLHNQHQQQQQGQQQGQQQQQGHMGFQEMSRTMWISNHSGGAASFSVPTNPEFPWSSPPPHPQTPSQALLQQQGTMQSINISANDSPQEELELELGLENHHVVQQQQQQLSAHVLFQQQHQEQQRRHIEQQQKQQQQKQQHRASIQHQHQQTFYIPQMQDDEDEDEDDEDESNGGLPDHV
ncbi:hypothetical protein EC957_003130 [Mortierella hygrophila]|uniref:Zn(2)-C6 fungal-type domain-containing protein n=1 Tax=Mortierella hygrophila TaxID=979708 RepID=A0A9P6F464_9FUNG|nr:hypothetical protein EC957_003130 [Mortierella hygrophila]